MVLTNGIFIVAAKRTPFGTYGGKFVKTSVTDLGLAAAKAAIAAGNINPEIIDHVVYGNVRWGTSSDGTLLARHIALKAGIPIEKPAYSLNRLCGSGFQSVVNASQSIAVGESKVVLTGGAENLTQSPYIVRNVRFGAPLGANIGFEDSLWTGYNDTYCDLLMAKTAEKLGAQFNIAREEVNKYGLRSQQLWKKAAEGGVFDQEIAPVKVVVKKKEEEIKVDEHPRPQTTIEGLNKLSSLFQKNGLVTAGTASGICDGAGAVIVASEEAINEYKLTPLARLVGYIAVGVEPSLMGIGPSPAIKQLLKETGKSLDDIDIVEINEAFAAQVLACVKDLNLDIDKLNPNGGAIAIGHPSGASGSRITAHIVHELRRTNKKLGIGSACIGGGQGIALLIEKC